ncbi:DNA adenine methylase [Klebsiella pneumoniae]|nr:DNA adenine methylase [Klebsiella pneumoniae]
MLDLFADDSNAKCPVWYTAEDNALTQDWSGRLAELGWRSLRKPALQPLSVPRKASYHWHDAHHELCSCAKREGWSLCLPGEVSHKRNMVGRKMRITSALFVGELVSICPSGLSQPTTNKGRPVRFSLAPLSCLISHGLASGLVTSSSGTRSEGPRIYVTGAVCCW